MIRSRIPLWCIWAIILPVVHAAFWGLGYGFGLSGMAKVFVALLILDLMHLHGKYEGIKTTAECIAGQLNNDVRSDIRIVGNGAEKV